MIQTQAVYNADLTEWLSDLDKHSEALKNAILGGQVVVTSRQGFDNVLDKTREALLAAKNADENARQYQIERDEFARTLVCLLKAFEGIASSAEDMMRIAKLVGVGEDGKMPTKMKMGISAVSNMNQIIGTASNIVAGFKMEWLMLINFERVSQMLSQSNQIDLSMYAQLGATLRQLSQKPETDTTNE